MSPFFGKSISERYVIHDIEAFMKHWTKVMGIGPFFYLKIKSR
jgi:hypothetical protein